MRESQFAGALFSFSLVSKQRLHALRSPISYFHLARRPQLTSIHEMLITRFIALFMVCLVALSTARSENARIAVASNFHNTLARIIETFEQITEHRFTLIIGSSGKLYAQIRAGAPYDAFFSADSEKPAKLAQDFAYPDSRIAVYAHGRLVLWVPGHSFDSDFDIASFIRSADTGRIAIANPKLAPYGQAAIAFLKEVELLDSANEKLIYGENISQAFHFVASGAADAGFIAHSLILSLPDYDPTSVWLPDLNTYPNIKQAAIQLTENPAATDLFTFLKTQEARNIVQAARYELPDD